MITDSVPIPDSRLCSWSAGIRSPHDPTRTERDATQGTHDIPGVVTARARPGGNRHPRREGIGGEGDNPVRSMYANSTLNVNFNHISQHDRNLYRMLYRHHNSVSGYNPTDSINHAKPHINTTPHCTGLTPLTPVARHTEADSHSLTAASTGPRPASRLGMGSARISTHMR